MVNKAGWNCNRPWNSISLSHYSWRADPKDIDPLGRFTITTGSDHNFHPWCLYISPQFLKSHITKQISSENSDRYWQGCGSGRVDHWWHTSSYIDPLGQPKVTPGKDNCFRTCCPSVHLFKSRKTKQQKTMFATGGTVSLAEWIIDDTCFSFLGLLA